MTAFGGGKRRFSGGGGWWLGDVPPKTTPETGRAGSPVCATPAKQHYNSYQNTRGHGTLDYQFS